MSHLRREFIKLLYQKRTYFGWTGLFLIPFLITVAVRLSDEGPPPPEQGYSMSIHLIASNGLLVAVTSLFALVPFLLPLLASMAGSQTIAGEAEKGTLRTVLMQPVNRGVLLLAKWVMANAYIAIGLVILIVGSLIAGGAIYGLKPLTLLSGQTVGGWESAWLLFLAYAFVLVGMAAVVSLAVAFSTLTDSSLTAVGAALVLVIIMLVLGGFSVFDFLRPYMFTSYFDAWMNFFRDPIAWDPVRDALINFVVWIVVTTAIAGFVFTRKDILS
jgi:ABC-2 type transport system permease protein